MKTLIESELAETCGGAETKTLPKGVTVWGIVVLIISNWSEIKKGAVDGWTDAGAQKI